MSDGITPLTPAEQAIQESQAAHEGFLRRDLIALDDLGNTVLLDGKNDETMSSHFARMATEDHGVEQKIGKLASEGLDLLQGDHGAKAQAGDLERAKTVEALEENSPGLEK